MRCDRHAAQPPARSSLAARPAETARARRASAGAAEVVCKHRDIWLATSIAALALGAWLAFCWSADPDAATPVVSAHRARPLAPDAAAEPRADRRLEDSLARSEIEQALVEAEPTAAMLAAARESAAAR
jgi:hypothetical protein